MAVEPAASPPTVPTTSQRAGRLARALAARHALLCHLERLRRRRDPGGSAPGDIAREADLFGMP